jgi:type IV pilus assembly protein PilV
VQLTRRSCSAPPFASRGVSMMEVLVTIIIVTAGLLGAAGMQSRLQIAEVEAYQRAQAIVLLQDMADRIAANRKNVANYDTSGLSPAYIGNGATTGTEVTLTWDCTASPPTITQAQKDLCNWSSAIVGASETSGGNKVGAMIGARGCITLTSATMPREAKVALVWQGLNPTRAPLSTNCGSGLYGNEATRRSMVAFVKIGCLQNDPATGVCITP